MTQPGTSVELVRFPLERKRACSAQINFLMELDMPKRAALLFASLIGLLAPDTSLSKQAYPPGSFYIDGLPVVCGPTVFVVEPRLNDVGMAQPGIIYLNPNYFVPLPTSLKLFWAAHECGHQVVGINESAADCWAIRTGRAQGWFPPDQFNYMIEMFRNNPGDMRHPPGPRRVQDMIYCYNQP